MHVFTLYEILKEFSLFVSQLDQLLPYKPICIPDDKEGFRFISPLQIVYVKAMHKYCRIYCLDAKTPYTVSVSIEQMSAQLPEQLFCRVHRSNIVSIVHVKTMNKAKTRLYSEGIADPIHISEGYQKKFLEVFEIGK